MVFDTQFKDHAVATCQTEVSADGFDIIRLSNSRISITVMPQLGGKIYTLKDLRTGRDWLWKNPHIALRHPSPNMDYDKELDSGGWDEVLFSVKPCRLDLPGGERMSIGDHGNAVDRPWQRTVESVTATGEAVCGLIAQGQSPDFKLQRTIVLDAEQARFKVEYRLSNTGPSPWPWLWCAHPLFAIDDGMRIKLPEGQPTRLVQEDDEYTSHHWPNVTLTGGKNVDLTGIFEKTNDPETLCQKLFVHSAGEVNLSTADGKECISMMYDPETVPWLGLWVNRNAWSGCGSEPYLNLGLEPATAPFDKLSNAVRHQQAECLQPGETRQWSMSIHLDSTVNQHA